MSSDLKPLIISPPFGTYINVDWATSVKGTFTAYPRPGNRFWKALKTVRPTRGGWVNKMGLLNPGIEACVYTSANHLYSVTAVDSVDEWKFILDTIPSNMMIEINISCPNANKALPTRGILAAFKLRSKLVVIKLPPDRMKAAPIIDAAWDVGITHFHACNTLSTDKGGQSGEFLKYYSIALIETIKGKYPDATVIGGGGIYKPKDVIDYHNAGASHYSLSTIYFAPWRVSAVRTIVEKPS